MVIIGQVLLTKYVLLWMDVGDRSKVARTMIQGVFDTRLFELYLTEGVLSSLMLNWKSSQQFFLKTFFSLSNKLLDCVNNTFNFLCRLQKSA